MNFSPALLRGPQGQELSRFVLVCGRATCAEKMIPLANVTITVFKIKAVVEIAFCERAENQAFRDSNNPQRVYREGELLLLPYTGPQEVRGHCQLTSAGPRFPRIRQLKEKLGEGNLSASKRATVEFIYQQIWPFFPRVGSIEESKKA